MDDLMILFFAPRAPLCQWGRLDQDKRIYRYCTPDRTTDIVAANNRDGWEVRQYTAQDRLVRSVMAGKIVHISDCAFAEQLTLQNHGVLGYELELKLLDAVPLDNQTGKK